MSDPKCARHLSLTRTLPANPDRLFDAWATAGQLGRWICPDPSAVVDVDIVLSLGGRYSIRMNGDGGPFTAHGTYREIERPKRLVYTWAWAGDSRGTRRSTLTSTMSCQHYNMETVVYISPPTSPLKRTPL